VSQRGLWRKSQKQRDVAAKSLSPQTERERERERKRRRRWEEGEKMTTERRGRGVQEEL
jgi:hypothetical protein